MKRVALLLVIVLLLFPSISIKCEAEADTSLPTKELREKYEQWVVGSTLGENLKPEDFDKYLVMKELYRHTDENEEIDWILLSGVSLFHRVLDWEISMRFGNRIITNEVDELPFRTGYGLYDAKQDTFFDLWDLSEKVNEYPGIEEALDQLMIGRPIGDADDDKAITILDATRIQRVLAEIESTQGDSDTYFLTAEFSLNYTPRYSYLDMDEDGDVTILDATAIQRHLAGLE